MEQCEVVVIGSLAIDRIMDFNGHYRELIATEKIEVLSVSVLVDSLDIAEGGTGGNITVNLAHLGLKPRLLASVGSDGQEYLERLAKMGIDVSKVNISDRPTATFNVLTDSAGNQVGGFYPGAMVDSSSVTVKDVTDDTLVWLAAYDPPTMRRIVQECKSLEHEMFYDPGQQVSSLPADDLKAGIDAAAGLIVNEYEYDMVQKKTGYSQSDLFDKLKILVVTHGRHGSIIYTKDQPDIEVKPVITQEIVDPTGAGDAYRSGFIYGYLRQWELAKCGRLGSVMASFALKQHGPQAEISKADIVKCYQDNFNEEIVL